MSRRLRNYLLAGITLMTVGTGLAAWVTVKDRDGIDPSNAAQIALGKTIYAEYCASCHGANLEGQQDWRERKPDGKMPAPPHDATGHTWHHPDDVLFGITKKGIVAFAPPGYESDMPAFGDVLTDEQIWAVLSFLKSSWPPEIQARQAVLKQQVKK